MSTFVKSIEYVTSSAPIFLPSAVFVVQAFFLSDASVVQFQIEEFSDSALAVNEAIPASAGLTVTPKEYFPSVGTSEDSSTLDGSSTDEGSSVLEGSSDETSSEDSSTLDGSSTDEGSSISGIARRTLPSASLTTIDIKSTVVSTQCFAEPTLL